MPKRALGDAKQRQVEILSQQARDLVAQHGIVPLAQLGQLIVGDPVGAALGLVEVAEPDHRHVLQPQHGGRQHPAMPGDQLAIVCNHAGHGPAELRHAGRDLRNLVGAVDFGIAGIGAQPVNRPGLDLARRKHEVHGRFSFGQGGQAETRRRLGQQQNRDPRCGENKRAREGYPPGAILR